MSLNIAALDRRLSKYGFIEPSASSRGTEPRRAADLSLPKRDPTIRLLTETGPGASGNTFASIIRPLTCCPLTHRPNSLVGAPASLPQRPYRNGSWTGGGSRHWAWFDYVRAVSRLWHSERAHRSL